MIHRGRPEAFWKVSSRQLLLNARKSVSYICIMQENPVGFFLFLVRTRYKCVKNDGNRNVSLLRRAIFLASPYVTYPWEKKPGENSKEVSCADITFAHFVCSAAINLFYSRKVCPGATGNRRSIFFLSLLS